MLFNGTFLFMYEIFQGLRNTFALVTRFFFPVAGVDFIFFSCFFFLYFFFEALWVRESMESFSDEKLSHKGTIRGCNCMWDRECDCKCNWDFVTLDIFPPLETVQVAQLFRCFLRDSILCCRVWIFEGTSSVTSFKESALIVKKDVLRWHISSTLEFRLTIFCHFRGDFFFLGFCSASCRCDSTLKLLSFERIVSSRLYLFCISFMLSSVSIYSTNCNFLLPLK